MSASTSTLRRIIGGVAPRIRCRGRASHARSAVAVRIVAVRSSTVGLSAGRSARCVRWQQSLGCRVALQLAHAAALAAFEQLQDRQTAFEGVQFLAGLVCAVRGGR